MSKDIDHIIANNKKLKALKLDLLSVTNKYKGLSVKYKNGRPERILGNFKVIDNNGIEQGNWDIEVSISINYPFFFPEIIETSNKIKRSEETHVSENGRICLENDVIIQYIAITKGITYLDFFEKYVFKYFCWILLFQIGKTEKLDYWKHKEEGYQQFFYEILETTDDKFVKHVFESVLNNKLPNRNDPICVCGNKKKYKLCHESKVEELKKYGRSILIKYVNFFK